MQVERTALTFAWLDDLALAATLRRADPRTHLKDIHVDRVGPLLEAHILARGGLLPFEVIPASSAPVALRRALQTSSIGRGSYGVVEESRLGFIATSRDPEAEDQTEWLLFCRRAQEAAELSLPKPVAQGLVGALREIEDNVHVHSGRAYDGVVGFRGTADEFEFAVADSGIGILRGLRQSPDYQSLNDAGTAIRLALTDGYSRFRHEDPGRGFGFHGLFVGLANLNGELRFRSDDHAVTIDGSSPNLVSARMSQKVDLQGFVASVTCGFRSAETRQ
jgi:hypothetical protein